MGVKYSFGFSEREAGFSWVYGKPETLDQQEQLYFCD